MKSLLIATHLWVSTFSTKCTGVSWANAILWSHNLRISLLVSWVKNPDLPLVRSLNSITYCFGVVFWQGPFSLIWNEIEWIFPLKANPLHCTKCHRLLSSLRQETPKWALVGAFRVWFPPQAKLLNRQTTRSHLTLTVKEAEGVSRHADGALLQQPKIQKLTGQWKPELFLRPSIATVILIVPLPVV